MEANDIEKQANQSKNERINDKFSKNLESIFGSKQLPKELNQKFS